MDHVITQTYPRLAASNNILLILGSADSEAIAVPSGVSDS